MCVSVCRWRDLAELSCLQPTCLQITLAAGWISPITVATQTPQPPLTSTLPPPPPPPPPPPHLSHNLSLARLSALSGRFLHRLSLSLNSSVLPTKQFPEPESLPQCKEILPLKSTTPLSFSTSHNTNLSSHYDRPILKKWVCSLKFHPNQMLVVHPNCWDAVLICIQKLMEKHWDLEAFSWLF